LLLVLCCCAALGGARASPASSNELLFMSNREDSLFQLFRMDDNGRRVSRVLPIAGEAGEMTWSPDGTQVLYTAARGSPFQQVFVTALGDGQTRQLTSDRLPASEPVWAPDGKTVAFVSSRDGGRKVYLMDLTDGRARRLTNSMDDETSPRFSPDGRKLAFLASGNGYLPRVHVFDLTNGTVQLVSNAAPADRTIEANPVWSPSGDRLLYTLIKSQTAHMLVVAADGTGRTALTRGPSTNTDAQWSPDGRQISYLSNAAGTARMHLYLMNADGSDVRKLHGDSFDLMSPRWSVDGQRLFFVELLPVGGKIFSMPATGGSPQRLSGAEGVDANIQVCCQRTPPAPRMAVAH
jgi:TolB protein